VEETKEEEEGDQSEEEEVGSSEESKYSTEVDYEELDRTDGEGSQSRTVKNLYKLIKYLVTSKIVKFRKSSEEFRKG